MRLKLVLAGLAAGLVTACGAAAEALAAENLGTLLLKQGIYDELFGSSAGSQIGSSGPPSAVGVRRAPRESRLSGVLILEENEPLQADRVVRLNLATGRMAMEVDGYDPDWANGRIVFLKSCGEFLTGSQLAMADENGFVTTLWPCDRNSIRSNLEDAALSPDAQRIAVYDAEIARRDFYELAGHGVLVYDASGRTLGVLEGFTSPAWTWNGRLLLAGSGRDGGAPNGIYVASPDFRSAQRMDDGRLNNEVTGLVTHPKGGKAAFVYNEQLWEIDLKSGAPKRLLAYDLPVRFPAYSPDGSQIAFIVQDPHDERMRRGERTYFIHVFDGHDVIDVPIDFVPGGPISWAEESSPPGPPPDGHAGPRPQGFVGTPLAGVADSVHGGRDALNRFLAKRWPQPSQPTPLAQEQYHRCFTDARQQFADWQAENAKPLADLSAKLAASSDTYTVGAEAAAAAEMIDYNGMKMPIAAAIVIEGDKYGKQAVMKLTQVVREALLRANANPSCWYSAPVGEPSGLMWGKRGYIPDLLFARDVLGITTLLPASVTRIDFEGLQRGLLEMSCPQFRNPFGALISERYQNRF